MSGETAHSFFCSICKSHIVLGASKEKEARDKFHSLGHDDRKVAQLLPGPVGWYAKGLS